MTIPKQPPKEETEKVVTTTDQYGNIKIVSGTTKTPGQIYQSAHSGGGSSSKSIGELAKSGKLQEAIQSKKTEQEAQQKAIKKQEVEMATLKSQKQTAEVQALTLAASQELNPQGGAGSKFEALRSRRLAEAKQQITKPQQATALIGGYKVSGEVKPFKPIKKVRDTAIGGTAKRFIESGFKVDVTNKNIIATKGGRTEVFNVSASLSKDNNIRLSSSKIASVPSSAKLNISEFKNIQRKRFSEPYKRYIEDKKVFPFFGAISKLDSEINKRTGLKNKFLGESGTKTEFVSKLSKSYSTSLKVAQIPLDIIFGDIERVKKTTFYQKTRDYYPRESKTEVSDGTLLLKQKPSTFSDVLDLYYPKGLQVYRNVLPNIESVNTSLDILERIKPSESIREMSLLYLGGIGSRKILIKSPNIAKNILKSSAPVLLAGYVGAVGIETALAPREERIAIIGSRAIELGVGIASFNLGFRRTAGFDLKERFKLETSGRLGVDFQNKPPLDKYISLRVSEIKIGKGGIKTTIETIRFRKKLPGYDVQRFYFEPVAERQLALAKGGKDLLPKQSKYFPEYLKQLGERLSNMKLKDFGFNKPVSESQAYLLRKGTLKSSEIQTRLTLTTESGKVVPKYAPQEGIRRIEHINNRPSLFRKLFSSKKATFRGVSITEKRHSDIVDEFFDYFNKPKGLDTKVRFSQTESLLPHKSISSQQGILFGLGRLDISIFKIKTDLEVESKLSIREVSEERNIISPLLISRLVPKTDSISKTFIETKISTSQESRQSQDIITRQEEKVLLTTVPELSFDFPVEERTEPIEPIRPEHLIPDELVKPKFLGLPKLSFRGIGQQKGYNAYARSKGKKIKINKKPLPYNKAFNIGQDVIDNTASATFILEDTGKKTNIPDDLKRRGEFKLTRKSKNIFIEKNKFRIDSPGELAGITVKGWLARKKKMAFY